jgi:anti-anti-sigma factor
MGELTNKSAVKVIALEGAVRGGPIVDGLRSKVEQSISLGQARVVLDMSKVTSLDSSGIGVLVRSLTQIKQKGGTLKLVGLAKNVSQTLSITGVLKLFEVFPEVANAVESFAD